jgi:8-amino-7-oxononanoate synthase
MGSHGLAHDASSSPSLEDFYACESRDLLEKCRRFHVFVALAKDAGIYDSQYRVTLDGPLDHRIRVANPFTGREQEMVCFDSNSYLGLHLHPRVNAAVQSALARYGYGTPSAQVLGGTNRALRELEETVAAFHGRRAAIVFPSGYAANIGTLTALLRRDDFVAWDRFAHASIQDGCRFSGARAGGSFAHACPSDLRRLLARDSAGCQGKLVVSDGVFSMHGSLAPLPELRKLADEYGAHLMLDEAHSVGVIGATGRGLEEHFGLPGRVDVLMGTFSKAPGALGGYVCGSAELISYLRFFARAGLFTASLPAATCAGLVEAFHVMVEEPEHRERLWRNARRLWTGLRQVGFQTRTLESPILALEVGEDWRLWAVARELFDAGIKVGSASYPAVPRGGSLLRLTVNARHTDEDIDRNVEVLATVGTRHGLLGSRETA